MFSNSRIKKFFVILMSLTFFAFWGVVHAAIVPQTLTQLTSGSTHIVRAEVTNLQSLWNDKHTVIYTLVNLKVNEIIKGSISSATDVQVWLPGGQVGDTGLTVEHAASFESGQDVLLFLTKRNDLYDVTSWELGKFTVTNGIVEENNISVTEFTNQIKSALR